MNKQKSRTNPFRQNSDHTKEKYGIDDNNNYNKNGKNAISHIVQTQNSNPGISQPIFNYPTTLKSCLKISDKSKGVQKGKLKTPAQDRLQKIANKNQTAVIDYLKDMVDLKSTVKNVIPKRNMPHGSDSLKSNVVGKFTNDGVMPTQALGFVDCAKTAEPTTIKWSNNFIENKSISKVGTTIFDANKSVLFPSFFCLPENGLQTCPSKLESHIIKKGHDVEVQNHLKINDNSKIIGVKKFKSKTPAQDRLQKLVDKNKAALFESLKELVDVDMIVSDPKSHRKSIGIQKSHVTGTEPSIIDIVDKNGSIVSGGTMDAAYIIPDTNVFLNSLACIENVIEKGLENIIYVPFVVLQELDSIKQRRGEQNFTVKYNAKRAIRLIYELSTSENKHLQGQSAVEDKNRLIDSKSNDDKILNCCLQLVKQSKKVILVTNDLNLTNIAKFSGIETITHKRCMERFK